MSPISKKAGKAYGKPNWKPAPNIVAPLLENRNVYDLQVYFRDTPVSYTAKNICHMGTEGGLLRLINTSGETQWWPLVHVFNIRQIARRLHPRQL